MRGTEEVHFCPIRCAPVFRAPAGSPPIAAAPQISRALAARRRRPLRMSSSRARSPFDMSDEITRLPYFGAADRGRSGGNTKCLRFALQTSASAADVLQEKVHP
jgi:hypothetical protein